MRFVAWLALLSLHVVTHDARHEHRAQEVPGIPAEAANVGPRDSIPASDDAVGEDPGQLRLRLSIR